MISSSLGFTSREASKAYKCSYSRRLGALSTKDLTIADPSAEYAKRPRSSILEVFYPSLLELEDIPRRITRTVNGFGEEIVRVDGEIPVDLEVNNGGRFLFISHDQSTLTHGLHKYPAKFFPELPRWLIYKYSKEGDWVIDPFAGSATVNLECLLARRNSVGIDVDPFPRFLSEVKVFPLEEDGIKYSQNICCGQS